ncbi:TPA: hypothetical protein ACPOXD_001169 [Haemophilus influenzae]|uniref:hypothetical protein n=1 Tax=Haemophilus TaxID=724 RepID=UPI0005FC9380|nr:MULTISPECIES: hypothetical protein [Haemophilus]AKA47086.1 hypothetical protein C645_06575 [Haemophilus influenzae 2019]AWP55220.1 hypothetical protein DLK00_02510 [Haemophilus influenzae]KKZ20528.1 hypothetical protein AAY75_09455 [Haemophilus influenzae 2019]KMZ24207.1 hypothetical protein ABN54_03245 [Haemophilus influenzae]KMZ26703.1 hypothetical protein ABN48_06855 [Haemophilus influenzae]
MTDLRLSEQQDAVALASKAMTQDKAQAYELVGMLKAFDFTQKLVTVTTLKTINEIKQSKQYKGLELLNRDGELVTVTSFKDFCTALGFSVEKIDADLLNLNTLGEEFFETSQRLGLGYREMRKLRQLPEEARTEIVEADYSEATDKEDLIEKIEDLTAKHAKEKEALQAQLKRKSDDYEAQAKVLATKNERINHLDLELAKKTKAIETQTPEQRGGVLREEAAAISYKAEAVLRGQVFQAFEALTAHTEATGIDHKQFMSGVLAEYQLILSELKERFGLDDTPSGEALPEWAREDYQPDGKLDESVTSILDEIEHDAHIQDAEVVG